MQQELRAHLTVHTLTPPRSSNPLVPATKVAAHIDILLGLFLLNAARISTGASLAFESDTVIKEVWPLEAEPNSNTKKAVSKLISQ